MPGTRPAGVLPPGAPGGIYSLAASRLKWSAAVRNARADAVEATIGTAPTLQIWSGAEPVNLTDTPAGTKLVEMTLPSDWMDAASGGVKEKLGAWSVAAIATGQQTFFRILSSGGTVHMQDSCSGTGGGGKMQLDTASITSGQTVAVTVFQWTEGNADG